MTGVQTCALPISGSCAGMLRHEANEILEMDTPELRDTTFLHVGNMAIHNYYLKYTIFMDNFIPPRAAALPASNH